MKWILIFIYLSTNGGYETIEKSEWNTMSECFAAFDVEDEKLPKPKVNYQLVCVNTRR